MGFCTSAWKSTYYGRAVSRHSPATLFSLMQQFGKTFRIQQKRYLLRVLSGRLLFKSVIEIWPHIPVAKLKSLELIKVVTWLLVSHHRPGTLFLSGTYLKTICFTMQILTRKSRASHSLNSTCAFLAQREQRKKERSSRGGDRNCPPRSKNHERHPTLQLHNCNPVSDFNMVVLRHPYLVTVRWYLCCTHS